MRQNLIDTLSRLLDDFSKKETVQNHGELSDLIGALRTKIDTIKKSIEEIQRVSSEHESESAEDNAPENAPENFSEEPSSEENSSEKLSEENKCFMELAPSIRVFIFKLTRIQKYLPNSENNFSEFIEYGPTQGKLFREIRNFLNNPDIKNIVRETGQLNGKYLNTISSIDFSFLDLTADELKKIPLSPHLNKLILRHLTLKNRSLGYFDSEEIRIILKPPGKREHFLVQKRALILFEKKKKWFWKDEWHIHFCKDRQVVTTQIEDQDEINELESYLNSTGVNKIIGRTNSLNSIVNHYTEHQIHFTSFLSFVSSSPNLTHLDLSYNLLGLLKFKSAKDSTDRLADNLRNSILGLTQLKKLNLSFNNIRIDWLNKFFFNNRLNESDFLTNLEELTYLDLSGNFITDDTHSPIRPLCKLAKENGIQVNLSNNYIWNFDYWCREINSKGKKKVSKTEKSNYKRWIENETHENLTSTFDNYKKNFPNIISIPTPAESLLNPRIIVYRNKAVAVVGNRKNHALLYTEKMDIHGQRSLTLIDFSRGEQENVIEVECNTESLFNIFSTHSINTQNEITDTTFVTPFLSVDNKKMYRMEDAAFEHSKGNEDKSGDGLRKRYFISYDINLLPVDLKCAINCFSYCLKLIEMYLEVSLQIDSSLFLPGWVRNIAVQKTLHRYPSFPFSNSENENKIENEEQGEELNEERSEEQSEEKNKNNRKKDKKNSSGKRNILLLDKDFFQKNFIFHRIKGDGHCFLHAIGVCGSYYRNAGNNNFQLPSSMENNDIFRLRQKVAEYIKKNYETVEVYKQSINIYDICLTELKSSESRIRINKSTDKKKLKKDIIRKLEGDNEQEKFEAYLALVEHTNLWATQIEIGAVQNAVCKNPIIVLEGRVDAGAELMVLPNRPDNFDDYKEEKPPFFILYNGYNHYDLLIPKAGVNPIHIWRDIQAAVDKAAADRKNKVVEDLNAVSTNNHSNNQSNSTTRKSDTVSFSEQQSNNNEIYAREAREAREARRLANDYYVTARINFKKKKFYEDTEKKFNLAKDEYKILVLKNIFGEEEKKQMQNRIEKIKKGKYSSEKLEEQFNPSNPSI